MGKYTRNQAGFHVIESLLLLVIVSIIGFAGWYVWHGEHRADTNTGTTQAGKAGSGTTVKRTTPSAAAGSSAAEEIRAPEEKVVEFSTTAFDATSATYQAVGYVVIKKNETGDYPYFTILRKQPHNILLDYAAGWQGSGFVDGDSIGMGCLKDGVITLENLSDAKGMTGFTLSKEDTAKILAATNDKPITLEVGKLAYTSGRDALPKCYSRFSSFKVVD